MAIRGRLYMQRYFEINEHGHNIRCKLYFQDIKNIRKMVVFCHGFSGHKDNRAAERFAGKMIGKYKNSAMITFDWPSHGDDVKKRLRLTDCTAYLELVLAHIRQKYEVAQLYAYATSFGAYLLLKYIHEHGNPFEKVVLRCPAVNMYEVLSHTILLNDDMGRLQKGKDVLVGFEHKVLVDMPFIEELKDHDICQWDFLDYAEDMLILQGTADEVVSYEVVNNFAENNLIEMIPFEKTDHRFRDVVKMDLAIKYILEFYFLNNK